MSFFFLMCSERSGSNLITRIMNAHPLVCGPAVKHLINPLARNIFRFYKSNKKLNWDALIDRLYGLFSADFSIWKINPTKKQFKALAPERDPGILIKNIFIKEAMANGKKHLFIKENHIYEFILFLEYYFPTSKYIYQVRDPRDMALSWKKMSNIPGGIVRAAQQWKKDQMNFLKNFWIFSKQNRVILLKYEQLIKNPEVVTRNICNFFKLPYSNAMLDFYKDEATKKNALKQDAWSNLSRTIMSDNSKKYITELNEKEIAIIEKICYYEMKYLEYSPENSYKVVEDITQDDINKLKEEEEKNLLYTPSDGIKQNIESKKHFYQFLPEEI